MRPHSLELRNAQEELLNHPTNAEHSDDDTASDASAEQIFPNDGHPSETLYNGHRIAPFLMRALALLCAMSLSIGSHFGSYFLGPLKSRLSREIGTSNAEFSLMIAAFDLNSTWTPLIGGLIVTRLGTARTSVLATFAILLGQVILLFGDILENVVFMSIGLFIFGLGISPLAVVQETIVVRFFAGHGLGVSLAIGLLAGKGSSFLSARVSYPLSQNFGPHAPFVVSTLLAFFSFGVNLIYLSASAWLASGAGLALEPGEELSDNITGARMTTTEATNRVSEKRRVKFKDMKLFGDLFWLYICVNILCGAIWSPFTHLAANIIEQRYGLTEREASEQASLLLAGSIVLYPICGYLTDRLKHGSAVFILFIISSILTLLCYTWLIFPVEMTKTPLPAMISFGCGHGFSTLLLVILVPHIVPLYHVSTALGAHKSIEKAGSTISQTLAGLILDLKHKKTKDATSFRVGTPENNSRSIYELLMTYFFLNILQLGGTIVLWRVSKKLRRPSRQGSHNSFSSSYTPVSTEDHNQVPGNRRDSVGTWSRQPSDSAVASEESDSLLDAHSQRFSDGARLAGHLRNEGSWETRTRPLLLPEDAPSPVSYLASPVSRRRGPPVLVKSRAQRRRGKFFMIAFIGVIVATWVLFLGTAFVKLKKTGKT